MYKIDDQQDLLYSTGNSTLYSVIISVGKKSKKEYLKLTIHHCKSTILQYKVKIKK